MLPGFPRLLSGKVSAAPFSLSGSFESGLDGWSLNGSANRYSGASFALTGGWYVAAGSSSTAGTFDYVLTDAVNKGLIISLQIYAWSRINSTLNLQYKRGGGSFVSRPGFSLPASPSRLYQLCQDVIPADEGDLTIRFSYFNSADSVFLDDWAISGASS